MADIDLTELRRLGRRDQRRPCAIAEAVAQLTTPRERKLILAGFASEDLEVRRGARIYLQERGIERPSDAAVTHHRSGRCRCHD